MALLSTTCLCVATFAATPARAQTRSAARAAPAATGHLAAVPASGSPEPGTSGRTAAVRDPERPPMLAAPSRQTGAQSERGGGGSVVGRVFVEALSAMVGMILGTGVGFPFILPMSTCIDDCPSRSSIEAFALSFGFLSTISLASSAMVTLAGNLVFDQPGSYGASLLGAIFFGLLPAPMLFTYRGTRRDAAVGLATLGGVLLAPLGAVVGYEAGLYMSRSEPPGTAARQRPRLARPAVRLLPWLHRDPARGALAGGVGLTGRW